MNGSAGTQEITVRTLEDLTPEELVLLDRAVRMARESYLATPVYVHIAASVFQLAVHDLVDSAGINIEGYNRDGFNEAGFDRAGFNAQGLNARGFDIDGFDIAGLDSDGFDRDGLNANGEDKYCYDRWGNKRPAKATDATDATDANS